MSLTTQKINTAILEISESLKKIADRIDQTQRIEALKTVIRIKEEYIRQKGLEDDYELIWLPKQEKDKPWLGYWEK